MEAETVTSRAVSGIRLIIQKIKDFIIRLLDPLIRRIRGIGIGTRKKDREVIKSVLRGMNIRNPQEDKIKEQWVDFFGGPAEAPNFQEGLAIYDLDKITLLVDKKLKLGIPIGNIEMARCVIVVTSENKSLDVYKDKALRLMDYITEIEEGIRNSNASERTKHQLYNSIMILSNRINMSIQGLYSSLKSELDGITKDEIDQLRDMNQIASFLNEIQKASPGNMTIIKTCLIHICAVKGWTCGNGSARFYIPDPDNGEYGYKFSLGSKGISDNRREYNLWNRVKGETLAKYLIPIHEISSDGLMLKVSSATDINQVDTSEISRMSDDVKKVQNENKVLGDVILKLFGTPIYVNPGNVGRYKGNLVIIDYGNSTFSWKKFNH